MTPQEAAQVLARAVTFGMVKSPTNTAEAQFTAQSWADALAADLTLQEADRIVVEIAGEERDRNWITPGDVNMRHRVTKRNNAEKARTRATLRQLAATPTVPMPDHLRDAFYPNPTKTPPPIPCPYCHAPAGTPCVTYDGVPLSKSPAHPARLEGRDGA